MIEFYKMCIRDSIWPVDGGTFWEWGWWDGGYAGHRGVDIGAPYGTDVYAGASEMCIRDRDEWLYCEKTWTIDDSDIAKLECVALALDKNGMIEACNIKLEKGTKATDWSPAVEEDTERIASLEARVAALEAMAVSGGEV